MRQSGRTTRLVDQYIQELFAGKTIEIRDHHYSYQMRDHLLDIISRRLLSEHNMSIIKVSSLSQDVESKYCCLYSARHGNLKMILSSLYQSIDEHYQKKESCGVAVLPPTTEVIRALREYDRKLYNNKYKV